MNNNFIITRATPPQMVGKSAQSIQLYRLLQKCFKTDMVVFIKMLSVHGSIFKVIV
jgi:hypothetical protein